MNIFYLDKNPTDCALYHCDRHIVKMILEYSGMLSYPYELQQIKCPLVAPKRYLNHPCSVWARENISNFEYLRTLLLFVANEYTYRYDKIHSYSEREIVKFFFDVTPNLPEKPLTKPYLAMPDNCKDEDPVIAYRNYYMKEKQRMAKWKRRSIPSWYKIES